MSDARSPSPRRYPMPKVPNTMDPFVHGLDPSGRRMVVLLPRDGEEVGVILTTTILRMERDGNILTFTVREYTNEERCLTAVVFDIAAGEMLTGDEAPCFFAIDDTGRNHVDDVRAISQHQFPGAWLATV